MKKRFLYLLLTVGLGLGMLTGCGGQTLQAENTATAFDPAENWDTIVEQAKGTKVTFYGWGGDENRNQFITEHIIPALKEQYDLTLELVPMDIDQILNKLSGEKQAGAENGSIDMIWINGENFYTCKENEMLFGPFVNYLPAYQVYIDPEEEENKNDFGYPIEGYEAPYGRAQMVLIHDSAQTPETPANTEELLAFAKKYAGQVTYPAPPDFTGSAFVRNIIYDICGYEQFMDMEANKETVREAIAPALAYLRALNPYLWNQGKTFPPSSTEVENMFLDGELVLSMSYESYTVSNGIDKGTYPENAESFLLDHGTIGNTNYIAIAYNAPNKAGAMVAINYILSAEGQISQFKNLRILPVLDTDKLNNEEKTALDAVDIGQGVLTPDALLQKRLPEMPAKLVPIIEELWLEEVVGR